MHYQHGPRQHSGLAAQCVSMHHSRSAGNHSSPLRLPQAAAQDPASSGAHSAQFQQTNSSHLFFSGSHYLRHTGPLGRTLVSWSVVTDIFKPAGPEAECCRGVLPMCSQPLEVHKQICCVQRNGSWRAEPPELHGALPLPLTQARPGKHSKKCFRETQIILTYAFYFQYTPIIFKF